MAQSAYMALYKTVMNINEDGRRPHGWHGLEGDRWIKRDSPTVLKPRTDVTRSPKQWPHKGYISCIELKIKERR